MVPRKVHLQAAAKINLSLSVDPPREDGMHPITSKIVTIGLFDDLEVTRLDNHALSRYAIVWHDDAPKRTDIDWPVSNDLAVRAHHALEKLAGRSLPVQLKLEKRIPVGGGLGGGSADAAAMLLATNHLFDLNVDLSKVALQLGSDVPFLLHGGTGMVRGVGEDFDTLEHEELHFVLIFPDYSCSTASVYDSFDALGCPNQSMGNDLLIPACEVEGRLGDDIAVLQESTNLAIHLSGSGSTMFIICDNALHAETLAETIEKQTNFVAVATKTYSANKIMERT